MAISGLIPPDSNCPKRLEEKRGLFREAILILWDVITAFCYCRPESRFITEGDVADNGNLRLGWLGF
jgi:hypothetical protein